MALDLDFDLKALGIALPFAAIAWKWLRSHNDRTLSPPGAGTNDAAIERLVHQGKSLEAIKAIRSKYKCSLAQAKAQYDAIRERQSGDSSPR